MKRIIQAIFIAGLLVTCSDNPSNGVNVGEIWIVNNFEVVKTTEPPQSRSNLNDSLVSKIRLNTKIEILATEKNILSKWYRVNVLKDGGVVMTGWVASWKVLSGIRTNEWGTIKYAHSYVNVRESRDDTSNIVAKLSPNQKIKAYDLKEDWYAVYNIDDKTLGESTPIGYVYHTLLHSKILPIQTKPTLQYTIVGKNDVSYAGTPRMTNRVVLKVTKIPTEQQMKDVATAIWKNGNKSWKEFTVFIYLPDMDTDDIAYGVAEFRPNGLKEFRVQDFVLSFYGDRWK